MTRMDVREKLVEIVCDAMERDGCIGHCNNSPCFEVERVVNTLIANGVTVVETDRDENTVTFEQRKGKVSKEIFNEDGGHY